MSGRSVVVILGSVVPLLATVAGTGTPVTYGALLGAAGLLMLVLRQRSPRVLYGACGVFLAPVVATPLVNGAPHAMPLLLVCIALVCARSGAISRWVPVVALLVGVVEGVRLGVLGSGVSGSLILAGLASAASMSIPAAPRAMGLGLLAAALVIGVEHAFQPNPQSSLTHATAKPASIARGLHHLSQNPRAHDHAIALASEVGWDRLLYAGWAPETAVLEPDVRLEVANSLDLQGRGGEGRRLLRAGKADGRVAWALVLAHRLQGIPDPKVGELVVPEAIGHLPGEHPLDATMLTNGALHWDFHVEAPCMASVMLNGEQRKGPPVLSVRVDAEAEQSTAVDTHTRSLEVGLLSAGPHRVRFEFVNDFMDEQGDRNIMLQSFSCVALSPAE